MSLLGDSSFSELHDGIKQIALSAVGAAKPMEVSFGTVTSVSPLEIQVEQNKFLSSEFLTLTSLVQDFTVDMTVDHKTEPEEEHTHKYFDSDTGLEAGGSATRTSDPTTHLHAYAGKKSFTVHLGLRQGESVILLRMQGGQRYVVLDRVR